MAVTVPELTYTITHYNKGTKTYDPVSLGGSVRASFVDGWNKINVTYNSTISLSRYEVRVTLDGADYGVGIGNLAYYTYGSIAANTDHSYEFTINSTTFNKGDGTYRISMYARNDVDGTWDATYFLLDINGNKLTTTSGEFLEAYTQDETAHYMFGGTAKGVTIFTCDADNKASLRTELINAGYTTAQLENAYYFDMNGYEAGTVIINAYNFGVAGDSIKLIHKKSSGTWETLFNGVIPANYQITLTFTEFGTLVKVNG